jgi:hypothetical protein
MKERAKDLLSKDKNELPPTRTLYVSLDRADNVIEGGPPSAVVLIFGVAAPSWFFEWAESLVSPRVFFNAIDSVNSDCFTFELRDNHRPHFQVWKTFPYTKDCQDVGVSSWIDRKNGAQVRSIGPSEPQRFDAGGAERRAYQWFLAHRALTLLSRQ